MEWSLWWHVPSWAMRVAHTSTRRVAKGTKVAGAAGAAQGGRAVGTVDSTHVGAVVVVLALSPQCAADHSHASRNTDSACTWTRM